jgi:hypothetical protein
LSFFNELKRRNVFRVGLAYVMISWLMLQVVDVVVPILELQAWVSKLVFLLLAIGLPVMLHWTRPPHLRTRIKPPILPSTLARGLF